jgi:hypothetical protein
MSQASPVQKIDPIRVTETGAIGTDIELVLVLQRSVFSCPDPKTTNLESAPSAFVAMAWPVAKQLRDMLVTQVANHEKKHGPIFDIPQPVETQPVETQH